MIKLCEGIMNNDKNIKVKAEKCLTLIRSEKRVGAIQDADTVLADIIDAVDIEVEGIGEEAIKLVTKSEDFAASCKLFNPNAITIHNKEIAVCDNLIKNADAVFFKVDSMSHGLYEKCKSIAQKANVPVAYIPEITSVKMIEKTAYEMLTSMLVKKEG